MKKKILAVALCLVMVLTMFAGCGSKAPATTADRTTFNVGFDAEYPPFGYMDDNGDYTGFDLEVAQAVCDLEGWELIKTPINWDAKDQELNSGAIDCIWNGFTANSSDNGVARSELVDFSYGYMLNQQCIVVKKDNVDAYKSEADLTGKKACVEAGSAGASYAESVTDKDNIFTATAQINAFTEVKSGAVDFIVVDILLAQNICGKGDYADLAIVEAIELESEIYAVGFKKGSDLTEKVNEAIKELEENGKLMALAEKYGFENVLKVTETIK